MPQAPPCVGSHQCRASWKAGQSTCKQHNVITKTTRNGIFQVCIVVRKERNTCTSQSIHQLYTQRPGVRDSLKRAREPNSFDYKSTNYSVYDKPAWRLAVMFSGRCQFPLSACPPNPMRYPRIGDVKYLRHLFGQHIWEYVDWFCFGFCSGRSREQNLQKSDLENKPTKNSFAWGGEHGEGSAFLVVRKCLVNSCRGICVPDHQGPAMRPYNCVHRMQRKKRRLQNFNPCQWPIVLTAQNFDPRRGEGGGGGGCW